MTSNDTTPHETILHNITYFKVGEIGSRKIGRPSHYFRHNCGQCIQHFFRSDEREEGRRDEEIG
jgi:hypothetical protein